MNLIELKFDLGNRTIRAMMLGLLIGLIILILWGSTLISHEAHAVSSYQRLSAGLSGQEPDGISASPSISADGRYVVFKSAASNLVLNDENNATDVFVFDRQNSTTQLVSLNSSGQQGNGPSGDFVAGLISADGKKVLFGSSANNLGGNTIDGSLYVKNLDTGTTTLIATNFNPAGSQYLTKGDISADGNSVLYEVNFNSSNQSKLFLYNLLTNTTTLVATNSAGQEANGWVGRAELSSDGKFVAFESSATNLVPSGGNSNGVVYVKNLETGGVIQVSTSTNAFSVLGSISSDGHYLVFTDFVNYYRVDLLTGESVPIQASHPTSESSISDDGRYVAFDDTVGGANGLSEVHFWNSTTGTISTICSINLTGDACGLGVTRSMSIDGTVVAYQTFGSANSMPLPYFQNIYAYSQTLDNTPPIISSLTWTDNPLQQGQETTLSIKATDNSSGVSSVQYSIDGSAPNQMTYDSVTNSWNATFGSELGVNTYNVAVRAVDGAGNTSSSVGDILVVYSTTNGYVTGHAKTSPTASDTMPITRDTSNNPAKLILGFTNAMAPASGSFDIDYSIKNKKNEFSLSSTSINWVVVQDPNHASILGHADMTTYINDVKTVVQNVAARFDLTLGNNGSPDHISIKIFSPGVDPSSGTPAYIISDDVITNGSNLKIHP